MTAPIHTPNRLLVEAASLLYMIGGMRPQHLVVVGGLVPPLLVPGASTAHIGSADVDLSLSVAITRGRTAEYYRSLEKIIEPYFELVEGGFRWKKKDGVQGLPLLVDFLGPEIEATALEDGTLGLEDQTAAANTGRRLRPFPLASGALVDEDAMASTIEVESLVYKPGVRAEVDLKHAGPVGFLASKADALDRRDDPKDGYDVSWWCIQAAPTFDQVARLVTDRPAFKDEYFPQSVAILQKAFKSPEHPGPSGYARETNPRLGPGDDAYEQDRNTAYRAVSEVVRLLHRDLWS